MRSSTGDTSSASFGLRTLLGAAAADTHAGISALPPTAPATTRKVRRLSCPRSIGRCLPVVSKSDTDLVVPTAFARKGAPLGGPPGSLLVLEQLPEELADLLARGG